MKRILYLLLSVIVAFSSVFISFAHGGRTDASGGHRDNKNKSGLGYYHYHCGGTSAHLHTNGACPYSANTGNSSSSIKQPNSNTSSKSSSSTAIKVSEKVQHIVITAEKAPIHEKASTESRKLVTAVKGQTFKLIGSTKSFWKIEFKKKNDETIYTGYILRTEAKEK